MRYLKEFNIQNIVEGAYYPGGFIIQIGKVLHDDIGWDEFSDEDLCTFAHEYIHFLQDISTTHGYVYYYHKAQLMNMYIYYIQNSKKDSIDLPLKIEEIDKDAYIQDVILDSYVGDSEHIVVKHINAIKQENNELAIDLLGFVSDEKYQLESVVINYDVSKSYVFGNVCVIESMAYLIERYIFKAKERKNEFPYNSCEEVCRYYYPELLAYPYRIVMLCELALMYIDCGNAFYNFGPMSRFSTN